MSATDIVINFLGNAAGLNQAAGQATSRMDKFKSGINKAAVGIMGSAVAIGASAINIASDTSESASKVATLFGKNAAEINKFAASAATAYGMSKQEALDTVGAMGAVQIAMGVQADQAAKLSLEYTKLAVDLGSFNNASSEEVSEALTNSLSGEYEMLKKYGIVVNDVTLSAEAQRIGMKKTGATWDSAQKQQLSYNIIMASTKKAQGDFARTQDGMANQTKKLSATMVNLQGELGAKLLPIVVAVMSKMNMMFMWMEKHQTTTKVLAITIGSLGAAIVALSVGFKVVALVTNAWAMAWRLLATVMWANPVFLIAGIILGVGAALVIAYKKSETFRNVVNKAFEAVRTVVITVISVMASVILGFWGMVINGAAKAFGWVPGIGKKLKGAAAAFAEFRTDVQRELDNIKDPPPVHITVNVDDVARKLREAGVPNAGQGAKNQQLTLETRASGGPVRKNRTYLVGERGPELWRAPGDGTIVPNHDLGGPGGGGPDVLNLTLDLGEGISQRVQVDLRARDAELKRRVNASGRR